MEMKLHRLVVIIILALKVAFSQDAPPAPSLDPETLAFLRTTEGLNDARKRLRVACVDGASRKCAMAGLAWARMADSVGTTEALTIAIDNLNRASNSPITVLRTKVLTSLAGLYMRLGRIAIATPLYREALAIDRTLPGEGHPDLALLINVANLSMKSGLYDEAEKLVREARQISEQQFGVESLPVATTVNMQAVLCSLRREPDEAEPLFLDALTRFRKLMRPADEPAVFPVIVRQIAQTLGGLGKLYIYTKRYEEAETVFVSARNMLQTMFSEDDSDTRSIITDIAVTYAHQRRYSEAMTLFGDSLEALEQHFPNGTEDTISILNGLADLHKAQGRQGVAATYYLRASTLQSQLLGPEHVETATTLANLAYAHAKLGQYQKAERLLKKVLPVYRARLGSDYRTAVVLSGLIAILIQQEQLSSAEVFLPEALAIINQEKNRKHTRIIGVLNTLGVLCINLKKFNQARELLRRALDIGSNSNDDLVAYVYNNLGTLYMKEKDYAAAEAPLREARKLMVESQSDDLPTINENLIYCLWRANKLVHMDAHLLEESAVNTAKRVDREVIGWTTVNKDALTQNAKMIRGFVGNGYDLALTIAFETKDDAVRRAAMEAGIVGLWTEKGRFLERKVGPPISLKALQGRLRAEQGQLEIGTFLHINPNGGTGSKSYAACVITKSGDPQCRELSWGSVEKLNVFLKWAVNAPEDERASRDPNQNPLDPQHGQALTKEFQPLLERLSGITELFTAPDGELSRLPLSLLKTTLEPGAKTWGDTFKITYVNSGRDLLWHTTVPQAAGLPLAVGLDTYGRPPSLASRLGSSNAICPIGAGDFQGLTLAERMASDFVSNNPERALVGRRATKTEFVRQLAKDAPRTIGLFLHGCKDRRSKEFAVSVSAGSPGRCDLYRRN